MDSSSSDNDAYMRVDNEELLEEYSPFEWYDGYANNESTEISSEWGSALCTCCRSLFSGQREALKFYKHYYYLSTLKNTARRGCHLCKMVESRVDRETTGHLPSEVMKLTFQLLPSSIADPSMAFELWFHYLRACKNPEYGEVVWGIKIIDFLPPDCMFFSPLLYD